MSDDKKDDIFYGELQETLRSYDNKLWQVPSLFFVAVGFIFSNVKECHSLRSIVVLIVGSLFLWILILLYTKAHFFHISIQKKINAFDEPFRVGALGRMPLTSMTRAEIEKRVYELEDPENKKGASFGCVQKFLLRRRISSWIRWAMLTVFLVNIFYLIYLVVGIF